MLTKERLPEVVEEVDRLYQERQAEIEPEEARKILGELGLPGDLLEEALVEVKRREHERRVKRRRLLIGAAALIAVTVVGGGVYALSRGKTNARAAIASTEGRVTTMSDTSRAVTSVKRAESPEVVYTIVLQNAPLGDEVPMACDWVAPSGRVAHQNAFRTKPIDKAVWNTHCRYKLPTDAETGTWSVRMSTEGRVLGTKPFGVE